MKNAFLRTIALITLSTTICLNAQAALNAYLELTITGEELQAESNLATIGGVDVSQMIECSAFEWDVYTDPGSGRVSGRSIVGSIKLVKAVDKSSPQLLAALTQNQVCAGTIHFFRGNSETGESEEYHSISFGDARIASIREWMPSTFDPVGANMPVLEEFRIQASTITITNTLTGSEHTISATVTD